MSSPILFIDEPFQQIMFTSLIVNIDWFIEQDIDVADRSMIFEAPTSFYKPDLDYTWIYLLGSEGR
jgi:hypothetical protein